ncbi:MAG: MerR family transcriptional regulator [Myxococcota bacterium]
MEIPDKIFFKIGEVSEIAGVKPYVLRYWESEFSISPHKSGSGQRLYRRKDIERILMIKRLLYQEGFTIAGARKHLSRLGRGTGAPDEEELANEEVEAEQQAAAEAELASVGAEAESHDPEAKTSASDPVTAPVAVAPVVIAEPPPPVIVPLQTDVAELALEHLSALRKLIQQARTLR